MNRTATNRLIGQSVLGICALGVLLLCGAAGCGIPVSTPQQISTFKLAGPVHIEVDSASLVKARIPAGAYRVVPGDLLEIQMPDIFRAISPDFPLASSIQPAHVRVSSKGVIGMPLVGEIPVAGKSHAEIESQILNAYYPRYVKRPSPVVVQVAEYSTVKVTILGAVDKPGVYDLRSDEMSLVALLMKAGGVVKEGAGIARIYQQDSGEQKQQIALPVKGLNIPFADVALRGGQTVEIQRLDPKLFTVIGLVKKPGSFPYPPGVQYNLLQALGFAGGVDDIADPQYVKVYRQDAQKQLVAAVFKIGQSDLPETANISIRPGDCVSVEQTSRTRTRKVLAGIFRIGLFSGATYSP